MMKFKLNVLFIAIAILFTSCEDEYDPNAPWTDDFTWPTFSINETVRTIEVDENVHSFIIEGLMSEEADSLDLKRLPLDWFVDINKTTAKHKEHFVNVPDAKFKCSEGSNIYLEVEIIPENITSEVEIYYVCSYLIPNEDKTSASRNNIEVVIKLVPKSSR